jgi:hypothetical protein
MGPFESRDEHGSSIFLKCENQCEVDLIRCPTFDPILPIAGLYIQFWRHNDHSGLANRKRTFHGLPVIGEFLSKVLGGCDAPVINTRVQLSFCLIP